jgi:hypothetical protein
MKRRMAGTAGCLLSMAFLLGGCLDPSGPESSTPFPYATPSGGTMQIDVSDLSSGTRSPQGICHAGSAFAVAWINLNVVVRLAVPVAAFNACIARTPAFVGNNTWLWTASGGFGPNAWTAELEGMVMGGTQVAWTMRISGTAAGYDHLLWFTGASDVAARSGTWTYYDPASPDTPAEVVQCDWSLPVATGEDRAVAFEVVDPGSADVGDRLEYELSGPAASVSHFDASAGTTATIEWDTQTGVGTFTPDGGNPCCWGPRPTFDDTACS